MQRCMKRKKTSMGIRTIKPVRELPHSGCVGNSTC